MGLVAHHSPAQNNQRLVLVGLTPGLGIGVYNGIGLSAGLDLRYQHPIAPNLALTAKTGIDVFRVKSRYAEQFRQQYKTTAGFSIPLTVGPRYYFPKGLYTGLNVGADIGVSKLAVTSFRFEPSVGMLVPLRAGRYLDVGTSVNTSFNRGSGVFSFNFAYGLPVSSLR